MCKQIKISDYFFFKRPAGSMYSNRSHSIFQILKLNPSIFEIGKTHFKTY